MKKKIINTLLIICAVFSMNYASSNARYIKEDVNTLQYSIKFNQMTGLPLISDQYKHGLLTSSNYETLNYFYTFNRSGNMLTTDTSDTYEIILSNNCYITSIYADNATITNNLITYNQLGNELVTVNFKCSVERIKNGDYLTFGMEVKEYFNNDTTMKFNYTDGANSIPILDYYINYPKPAIGDTYTNNYKTYIMPADRENKIGGLRTWLSLFAGTTSDTTFDAIMSYVKDVFNEDTLDSTNINILNNVRGLKALVDADGNFVFNIDDTFISRVKSTSSSAINMFYLLDGEYDKDVLFLDLLDQFNLYPKDSTEYNAIKTYLEENEQEGENVIDIAKRTNIGLTYNENDKTITVSNKLYFNIMHQIPLLKYTKTWNFGQKSVRLLIDLDNSVLSESPLKDKIMDVDNNNVHDLFSITDPTVMFDRYMYIEDAETILLHVYSNDEEYTYVEIIFITDNELNMAYNSKEYILEDLKFISTNKYNEELVLLDTDSSVIDSFNTLSSGVYNLNIGVLTITEEDQTNLNIILN